MSYTPFNAPLLSPLLGDSEIAKHFSVGADLECMLRFEAALATSQAALGIIPAPAAELINLACANYEPDMEALQAGVERDGMVVPSFIAQLRAACGEAAEFLHFESTSQDVIDTSLTLRLQSVNSTLLSRITKSLDVLNALNKTFGNHNMMAVTRMQEALPIKVSHRIGQWLDPLQHQLELFAPIEKALHVIQLGGPVGDSRSMAENNQAIRSVLAANLELGDPGKSWHTDRSRLISYTNWLAQIAAHVGKIGYDISLMALTKGDGFTFEGAGTSSAMAHKQNPVKAETLVAQARFAASLAGGMQQAAIHEQERSGASWALEWMILPQLAVVTGAALTNSEKLLNSIVSIGNP